MQFKHTAHCERFNKAHFRVLSVNGQSITDTPLLDTVTVPAAAADVTKTSHVAPGHCHLVDHEDNGMMGVVRVVPRRRTAASIPSPDISRGRAAGRGTGVSDSSFQ